MWETPVSAREEALIAQAVDKRKREFRAGRHAAHALFKQLGIEHPDLLKGVQREPAWPAGWVGSISHTTGFCAVILAPANEASSVGLDVELATPLSPELLDLICLPQELEQIALLRQQHDSQLPYEKLIFSAKESVHKAYFPLNHHTLDFLDARIDLEWDSGTFLATVLAPGPTPKVPVRQLEGQFLFFKDWIITTIVLPASVAAV